MLPGDDGAQRVGGHLFFNNNSNSNNNSSDNGSHLRSRVASNAICFGTASRLSSSRSSEQSVSLTQTPTLQPSQPRAEDHIPFRYHSDLRGAHLTVVSSATSAPEVVRFDFSKPDGPITTTTTDPADDATFHANYPALPDLALPFPVRTICITELVEMDCLGPQVDLVSCRKRPSSPVPTRAAFKY
ncbi:hypothetical protein VTK73DRAFT_7751 [Phialemonium thermophilum]|uniref:Uncharacterized protein n=1 Tax=Phialemonium thermophilum TaxID=223376 RepID=A0ABR3XRE6_9PEZI